LSSVPNAVSALAGCMVTRVTVDDSFTLSLHSGGRSVTLRIDGAGCLDRPAAAGTSSFDPDADPSSAAPLLGLLHERVSRAALAEDGALELGFEKGARLAVFPNEHSISWAVRVSDGSQACCLAEGRVVWE
jgi:hypothetical protein